MVEKIISLIEDVLNVPEGTITEDTRMEDVEAWDSLAHVAMIGELEERLGIVVPLEASLEIEGVKEILDLCKKYAGGGKDGDNIA